MTMKTCRKCEQTKSVTRFYKRIEMRDGRNSVCIDCILRALDEKRRAQGKPIRMRNSHRQVA